MNTGTIIIAAILLVLSILPFFLTGKKYRKQKKQLVQTLSREAKLQNNSITQYDASDRLSIGMDKNTGFLYFAKFVNDDIKLQSVMLATVSRCQMKTGSRIADNGERVIERIELVLNPVTAGHPQMVLEFYNFENQKLNLGKELMTASQWEQKINDVLKEIKSKGHKQSAVKKAVTV